MDEKMILVNIGVVLTKIFQVLRYWWMSERINFIPLKDSSDGKAFINKV